MGRYRFNQPDVRLIAGARAVSWQLDDTRADDRSLLDRFGIDVVALSEALRSHADALERGSVGLALTEAEIAAFQTTTDAAAHALLSWIRATRDWLRSFGPLPDAGQRAAVKLALRHLAVYRPSLGPAADRARDALALLRPEVFAPTTPPAWLDHIASGERVIAEADAAEARRDQLQVERSGRVPAAERDAMVKLLSDVERRWSTAVARSGGTIRPLRWRELEPGDDGTDEDGA